MSARADERRIGEIVGGKYRVVRFIAAGGMGVVYEAQHTLVRRRFAVKFLRPELADKRESLMRFQREAQTAGALESENLAAAVDFGVAADGSPFIVMEYLVGESLEALLEREGRLPLERAADLVQQACRGMQAAHAAGAVHRDLKPQNLFLCRREDGADLLKVLDFGVAKLEAVDRNDAATLTGTVLGTPAYMSPEQARGEKTIDHRADVYALGAILYELVSGQKPHPGDSHNAILHHIATQPAVPLDAVWPGLPAPLVETVARALASDPSARFASAELFGHEISTFAERRPWPATERTASNPTHALSDPTELADDAAARARAETVDLAKPASERTAPRAAPTRALIVLAGMAALVGLWLATRSPDDTSKDASVASAAPATPAAPPLAEVNAAERVRPAAREAEPAPAPSFEASVVREPPRRKGPPPQETKQAIHDRAPPTPPETAKSAAPLAFDRQNPYD